MRRCERCGEMKRDGVQLRIHDSTGTISSDSTLAAVLTVAGIVPQGIPGPPPHDSRQVGLDISLTSYPWVPRSTRQD